MNNTPENKVKMAIKKYLDTLKPELFYFAWPGGSYGRAGISDIIVCYGGKFLAIEIKSEEAYKKPTHFLSAAQQEFCKKVEGASNGLHYLCACSVEQVKNRISSLTDGEGYVRPRGQATVLELLENSTR
jgi:hypothetical protein